MTKTVAVVGTEGGVSFSGRGFDEALAGIGQNTGNALFQYAIWRRIQSPKFTCMPWSDVDKVRDRADVLVIPAANQIHPNWDLGGWADFIEACDLPVVCLGLGAQAKLGSSAKLPLKEGTLRYLRAVARRTDTIGVRGPFTKDVLDRHGIRNTEVIGCPSQTINPAITGEGIQEQIDQLSSRARPLLGWVFGTLEPDTRETEKQLSKIVRLYDHRVIFQTDERILKTLFNREPEDPAFLEWVRRIAFRDIPRNGFTSYLIDNGRFYSDARSWIDSMRRFDLVLGMRIHGSVAAIQAGRLGVCVAFDSRTRELAETMGYPFLPMDAVARIESIDDLAEQVVFSSDKFNRLKRLNSERIGQLLANSGCEISI